MKNEHHCGRKVLVGRLLSLVLRRVRDAAELALLASVLGVLGMRFPKEKINVKSRIRYREDGLSVSRAALESRAGIPEVALVVANQSGHGEPCTS